MCQFIVNDSDYPCSIDLPAGERSQSWPVTSARSGRVHTPPEQAAMRPVANLLWTLVLSTRSRHLVNGFQPLTSLTGVGTSETTYGVYSGATWRLRLKDPHSAVTRAVASIYYTNLLITLAMIVWYMLLPCVCVSVTSRLAHEAEEYICRREGRLYVGHCCSVDRSRHLANGYESSTSSLRGGAGQLRPTVKSEPGRCRGYVLSEGAPRSRAPAVPVIDGPTPPHRPQHQQMRLPESSVFHVEFGAAAGALPPPPDVKFVRVNANWTT